MFQEVVILLDVVVGFTNTIKGLAVVKHIPTWGLKSLCGVFHQ